jgi:hypothetical protein
MSGQMQEQERQCEAHMIQERRQRAEAERKWEVEVERKKKRAGSLGNGSDSGFESEVDGESGRSSADSSPSLKSCESGQVDAWNTRNNDGWRRTVAFNAITVPSGLDLKAENQALKIRIAELEVAVDSCLDLLG